MWNKVVNKLKREGVFIKKVNKDIIEIPDKKILINIRDSGLSTLIIYKNVIRNGNQDVNCKYKIRKWLLKNKMHFRYNRKFKRMGVVVDFYLKDKGKLCLDLCNVGDIEKAEILRSNGFKYRCFSPYNWKKALDFIIWDGMI